MDLGLCRFRPYVKHEGVNVFPIVFTHQLEVQCLKKDLHCWEKTYTVRFIHGIKFLVQCYANMNKEVISWLIDRVGQGIAHALSRYEHIIQSRTKKPTVK